MFVPHSKHTYGPTRPVNRDSFTLIYVDDVWIDNIKKDLLEIGVNVVDWIGLAQDRYR
jgi:hypothetical protein